MILPYSKEADMLRTGLSRAPWRDLKYALWLPFYLFSYWALDQVVDGSGRYWATQLPLDRLIPFQELFVIPYCLWYPLLVAVGLWLLFRDSAAFRRYMRFLAVTFFLSVLIWFLLPNGQDLRPAVMPRDNFFTHWVSDLYRIDTSTNVFPSVHVVGAVAAAWAVWDSAHSRLLRWSTVLLAVPICLSTLFIKQHSLLDVAGGLVLACAVGAPLYCRVPAPLASRAKRLWPLKHAE